jgi:hypothetical protein
MGLVWYRQDREVVLRRGERPDMAATRGCGPLDELLALHDELGIFAVLVALPADRDLYQDLQGLAAAQRIGWSKQSYVRTMAGHKEERIVDVAVARGRVALTCLAFNTNPGLSQPRR